jgi:hypothetical protein
VPDSHPLRALASVNALIVGALTAAFAALCAAFVRQDGLGTFADDSVSYLIMAQVFSPWEPASAAVAEAFAREAFYPPLFPLLLAATGAAHDFALAHVLNAILVAASLPLAYLVAARWMEDRRAALAAVLVIALLPSLWIHARGILSEPLFCVLLLAALWVMDGPTRGGQRSALLALLLVALVLTRTAGVAPALAVAAWALLRRGESWNARLGMALPALVALAAALAWIVLRPADVVDANSILAGERIRGVAASAHPWAVLAEGIGRQMEAMAQAWAGALLLFWVEGQPARPLLAGAVGALALGGLATRFLAGKADAWIVAAYLLLHLLWPFYDQMTRFLFPLVAVLVLYAFCFVAAIARRIGRPAAAAGLLAVAIATLAAPGLAFIHQRFGMGEPHRRIIDWYRTPDLAAARARAAVHLGLEDDMRAVRALAAPGERVMWVAPAYVALLAGRPAMPAPVARLGPEGYRREVEARRPDFVLLTAYHPRDTIRDEAWRVGRQALQGWGAPVRSRDGAVLLRRAP